MVCGPKLWQTAQMTWTASMFAILALLVTPGPTNTLMFLAGTERGWRAALRLIPAEVAAYLAVVVPLALLGAQLPAAARPMISVVAGVWVGVLAVRLWRAQGYRDGQGSVTARGVFTTTLLNPKALVFGLVLVPGAPALPPALAGFVALVALVAAGWAVAGALAAGPHREAVRRVLWVRRGAALWLAALSVGLVLRGMTG